MLHLLVILAVAIVAGLAYKAVSRRGVSKSTGQDQGSDL